ncbi:hypothetical protein GSI_02780 [Ganoderma sinense ZZ0214-1]|uniref:Uncharacterized protein n=1 Tax=Ganoderma sinense ZZ0214-1 TaxID=1077348 RepID=A0A2G8SMP1_9APHY|nr:hypothetical protein GSI_02780 [Ganoderma sinense ZZ0214-1]
MPAPGSTQWGTVVPGLDFIHTTTPHYYDWNTEYLTRVFTAARGVIQKRGLYEGWAEARWEVYDKYYQSLLVGLHYDRSEKAWFDDAVGWLDAQGSAEEIQEHIFGRCTAGIAFNKLLPEPSSPTTSLSARHPFQGDPSVSPASRPSAARPSG